MFLPTELSVHLCFGSRMGPKFLKAWFMAIGMNDFLEREPSLIQGCFKFYLFFSCTFMWS